MAYSQTSACSVKPSRFYDDLESASEGFFYKSCFVHQKEEEKARHERENRRNVYNALKKILSCCLGSREGSDAPNFSIMGYDFNDLFDDVSTTVASSLESGESIGYGRRDSLWAIEPSKRFKHMHLDVFEGKWLLLAWASRIVRGESVNKNMLNSILNECKQGSQKVASITKNVIKNFPGLNLAEDVSEMESSDLVVGMDNLVATLQGYIQVDRNTFVFLVSKEALYGIYYSHQGSAEYIVLFEIKLFSKGEIHYFARLLAFESFESVRDYVLSSKSSQANSKLYFYIFSFKKLEIGWATDVQVAQAAVTVARECDSDPKYDVRKLIKVLKSTQDDR